MYLKLECVGNSKFYMKMGTQQVPFEKRSQLHSARKNISFIGYFSHFKWSTVCEACSQTVIKQAN